MKKKVTFKEIAQLANVGVGTVSRYFNNYNISDQAKEKIKNVVDSLGYIPNFAASSLKKGSNDIYVIIPHNLDENANINIAKGIKESLSENFNFFIYLSSNEPKKYLKDVQEIVYRNPQTLIFLMPKETYKPLNDFISKIKDINVFIYNKKIDPKIPTFKIPDFKMFKELTTLIIEKEAPQKIAYLGLSEKDITTGKRRYEGFLQGIKSQEYHNYDVFLLQDNVYNLAYQAIEKIYQNGFRMLICATHTIALSAYNFIYENKIDDLMITDIAYESIWQSIPKNTYKIFIDYFLIGQMIGWKLFKPEKFKKYQNQLSIYQIFKL